MKRKVTLAALAAMILGGILALSWRETTPTARGIVDANDYKIVMGSSVDWRIAKSTGALLVEVADSNASSRLQGVIRSFQVDANAALQTLIPSASPSFTTASGGASTSSDSAVTLLTVPASTTYYRLKVLNGSGVVGWLSFDSGTTWMPWIAGLQQADFPVRLTTGVSVQFKRVAGGTNATGLAGFAS